LGKAHARRRIRNPDQVIAGGTLNLPASELGLTLERLIAVGTVELEFVGIHGR
jgi:hypothetical protein